MQAASQEPEAPPSRALLLELTQSPRLAGTTGSLWGARLVARHLESAGFQVELDAREVMLSLPRSIEFLIYAGAFDDRTLVERRDRFDPDAIPPGDVPKCSGWSASGRVRGPVVDAGFGLRSDFERLKSVGVTLDGSVALVRYGRVYRGVKVDLATEYGCAAVLLFSESTSDGKARGPTWPAGPWKPDWEAERGSILPMARTPGDPSTPGWASPKPGTKDAKRLTGKELDAGLPRIPCVPIGARDAEVLLERLARVTTGEKDGERVEQPLGPGPVQASLTVDQPREVRTIYNVIARLPGKSEDTLIAGAHRDAWVRGANDDGAGVVVLLRAAAQLGERARDGWKPEHTITFAFWDAEEHGLIGSTEWGEANGDWLRQHCLVYVNADVGVHGPRFQGASGSPGLLGALRDVLERVPAAERATGETPANLWQEWRASVKDRDSAREPRLSLPGSGSDFAVFAHHLNLPVLQFGFGGSEGGQYHTTFDDFAMVERYIDPGFLGHETAARFLTELLLDFDARPSLVDPAEALAEFARLARDAGSEVARAPRDSGTEPVRAPAGDPGERALWLGADRAERLAQAFESLSKEEHSARDFYRGASVAGRVESRPWYANVVWAPGLEDGYGSETFPRLREAAARGGEALDRELDSWIRTIAGSAAPAGN